MPMGRGKLANDQARTSRPPRGGCGGRASAGFTLIELIIAVAIILTLAGIVVPKLFSAINQARIAKAVGDIHAIGTEIQAYDTANNRYPNTLADIGFGNFNDPWGRPYQYLNFASTTGKGQMRKDRFLVPINTFFDLYSMGTDGKSQSPLTAKVSQDDIVWANDGDYVGLASQY